MGKKTSDLDAVFGKREDKRLKALPYFPVNFSSLLKCGHNHFLPGDNRVCMVCHQYGYDHELKPGTRQTATQEDDKRVKTTTEWEQVKARLALPVSPEEITD